VCRVRHPDLRPVLLALCPGRSLGAVQKALCSGSSNALLYDSLSVVNEVDSFERALGRIRVFDYGASVLAALLGALVAARAGLETTYWMSLGSLLISLVVSFSLAEAPREHSTETAAGQDLGFPDYIREAFHFFRQGTDVRYIIMAGMVVAATFTHFDEFWQLYADAVAIPVAYFGLISSGGLLVASVASALAYRAQSWLPLQQIMGLSLALVATGALMMSWTASPGGVLLLIPLYGASALTEPLVIGYLHRRAGSFNRATLESVLSAANRLVTIFVGLLFGWVSTAWSIFAGFRLLGIITVVSLLYYFSSGSLRLQSSTEESSII